MVYKRQDKKTSTIRVKDSTKTKLSNLNFVKKGMSFDHIINELLKKHKKGKK